MGVLGLKAKLKRGVAVPVAAAIAVFLISLAFVIFIATVGSFQSDEPFLAVDASSSEVSAVPSDQSFTESDMVTVHVAGSVQSPGLIDILAGARVADAVEAAGGPLETASLDAINLARVVIDGEQIFIPDMTEVSSGSQSSGLININTSSAEELTKLPRVGPALSERMVAWREQNGGFKTLEDLMQVSGIGPKVFEDLKEQVTL